MNTSMHFNKDHTLLVRINVAAFVLRHCLRPGSLPMACLAALKSFITASKARAAVTIPDLRTRDSAEVGLS
ncbi:hypothetical protein [Brucella thiophenivorans]|uniref:hypothetical protein n=1 Tax=Brucella thiophenivorans TaxID=571255 RepID=UPI000B986F35|nr:hypothetical protein [Brucella thiophenivorans]